MKLNELKANPGSRKRRKRVGRGNGSGLGTYAGRGMNGQSARSGGRRRPGFEGGQTPLHMRMPKLGGFRNPRRIEFQVVNVGRLNSTYKDGETVDRASLMDRNLIASKSSPIKVLGQGDLTIQLTVKVDKVSKSAMEKIQAAKGKIEAVEKATKRSAKTSAKKSEKTSE